LFIGRSLELADRALGKHRAVGFARVERCHAAATPSEQRLELGDGRTVLGGASRADLAQRRLPPTRIHNLSR
jgi:hypothetical protein